MNAVESMPPAQLLLPESNDSLVTETNTAEENSTVDSAATPPKTKTRASAKQDVQNAWASRRAAATAAADSGTAIPKKKKITASHAKKKTTTSTNVKNNLKKETKAGGGGGDTHKFWQDVPRTILEAMFHAFNQPKNTTMDDNNRSGNRTLQPSKADVSKSSIPSPPSSSSPQSSPPTKTTNAKTKKHPNKKSDAKKIKKRPPPDPTIKNSNQLRLSEHLTNLQITAAISAEIDAMRHYDLRSNIIGVTSIEDDDSDDEDVDSTAVPSPQKEHNLNHPPSSVLSVLPSHYDFSLALSTIAKRHKRAFHLLDLGSVIASHRLFFSLTGASYHHARKGTTTTVVTTNSGNNGSTAARRAFIRPQFSVQLNRDGELLKLLGRLGVSLRCRSVGDWEAVRIAGVEEWAVDDGGRVRKSDGYLRSLWRDEDGRVMEIAVDGTGEVGRVRRSQRRFQERRNRLKKRMTDGTDEEMTREDGEKEQGDAKGGRFLLRLPGGINETTSQWENLLKDTHDATLEEGGRLVGVSVDLSHLFTSADNDFIESSLPRLCHALFRLRLWLLSFANGRGDETDDDDDDLDVRIDFTGLPYPLTKTVAFALTTALATHVGRDVTPQDFETESIPLLNETTQQQRLFSPTKGKKPTVRFTADVSRHLVANAGGLCTKIIGKKQSSDVMHYYIDDGCYGSLGTCAERTVAGGGGGGGETTCGSDAAAGSTGVAPIPLYGLEDTATTSDTTMTTASSTAVTTLMKATVWGPTCDGLDKVCERVTLPMDLEVDRDWLIFTHLGCGGFGGGLGLGTAFNGFDPPDTAYCVLGYFSGGKKK